MSEIVFIRNSSTRADLGILEGSVESGGRRECVINGHPVFIPAGTVYTDATGQVWRTLKADSDAFFLNCDDPQEAIRLGVHRSKWRFVNDRDEDVAADTPGARFVGFFGVLRCCTDDSKSREGILSATANRVESIRHLQRMESELATAQRELAAARLVIEQQREVIEQQRAEVIVLRGRTGDENAKSEANAMVAAAAGKKGQPKPGLVGAKVD